jgi:formate dehydrogenase maturation protein FdhE
MTSFWNKQIQRADQLASEPSGSTELLLFYAQLLRAQAETYEYLQRDKNLSGDLKQDLPPLIDIGLHLLRTVSTYGPTLLAAEALKLAQAGEQGLHDTLLDYWANPSDIQFFPKVILQPYARLLNESGIQPVGRELTHSEGKCPFCGGNPQASFLQTRESGTDSGNRDLICATCLSPWEFRRVVCANCGEERPTKLGYFHSPEFEHIRIEACESCKHYIKGVDLTRIGFAQPLVDEIYAAPLDLWAREHGYTKIELNLVGL